MRQSFHKTERLKSKIIFDKLIASGYSVKKHPFILVWKKLNEDQAQPIRIAFSVSKKRFPLAVDRNQMKRKIREVYRLKKSDIYDKLTNNFAVLLIYTSKEINRNKPAINTKKPNISDNLFKTKIKAKLVIFLMFILVNQIYHFVSSNFSC